MRYIDLSKIDVNDPEVKRWINKAQIKFAALSALASHEERKKYLQKNNIWSEFKQILIRYYGEKCWYSECDLTGSFGDVDHFRPKNKSTDENKNVILPDGYWWLAYDYMNYRLSCEKCNRLFENGGKQDCFPLKPGTCPAILPHSNDVPLLLDPCDAHDVQLIDCDENGNIISLCNDSFDKKRINISRKVYNWKCFNAARRKIRGSCKIALEQFDVFYEIAPDKLVLPLTTLKELSDDKSPYSSFAKKYIKNWIEGKPYATALYDLLQD